MTDYVKAWQCIGCGSIEAPQTCIGVCEHRKVQFVYAHEHEQLLGELAAARREIVELRGFLKQLSHVTPHDDAWRSSYLALQKHASRLLGDKAPTSASHAAARAVVEAQAA